MQDEATSETKAGGRERWRALVEGVETSVEGSREPLFSFRDFLFRDFFFRNI